MEMRLEKIEYVEREGKPLEWTLSGLELGDINLIVGKNATGKSRVIAIIKNLAKQLLQDRLTVQETGYNATFSYQGQTLRYTLRAMEGRVIKEELWYDDEPMLTRDDKTLSLRYEKLGTRIEHEPSGDEVSAVSRKDKLQHPFLYPLRDWADAFRSFSFGSTLGKEVAAIVLKSEGEPKEIDDKEEKHVVPIFRRGKKEYGDEFTNSVLADMNELGYSLSEITADTPGNFAIKGMMGETPVMPPGEIRALGVREDGIEGIYHQDSISQGMFRALSLLIQVTYSQMSGRAHCIVIDDIGEGLDFDRSTALIKLLRKKAKESHFQLIMATNDQFVMNNVPLQEWSVLQRHGGRVTVRNIRNSKEVFENFKFVGMSNFAFFEMDFANPDSEASRQMFPGETGK